MEVTGTVGRAVGTGREKERGRKKSRLPRMALGMALCMVLGGLAACGKKEEKGKEPDGKEEIVQEQEGFCKQISLFSCGGIEPSFCDKGIVEIKKGILYFTEYETGMSYPLCSNAYCEHEPYDSYKNPDPVCEATLADMECACIYGDNIYVIQRTGMQAIRVQVRNLRESGYRVVADLPYCVSFAPQTYNAVRGDMAYLYLSEIKTGEEGEITSYTSNDLYTFLVELDLKTGKYKVLFHVEDGDRKYKVLRTVYAETGIYMQWYYEDTYYDPETMTGGVNEGWDKLYYVSYDGKETKELCPEVAKQTVYHKGDTDVAMIAGIGRQGVYHPSLKENALNYYRYDNTVEQVYKQPVEQEKLSMVGESGNYLLIAGTKQGTGQDAYFHELRGLNLLTGETLQKEWQGYFSFVPLCDGVFERFCSSEDESYKELWEYEQIFAEDGKPFFTIRQ